VTAGLTSESLAGDLALDEFCTSAGHRLAGLRLRYRVLGNPELARRHGWMLVFHALTGSAEVEAWWGPMVGPGRPLDTTRHAIVSANLLGSCYGSTGPREWWIDHPDPFPELTPSDLARAHIPLLHHLGVDRLALATGGSLGGMVALEWGRLSTVPVDRLVVFAAPAATSAQAIAWNAVQRMAIEADPGWNGGRYPEGEGPVAGLAAARALAMITYRSAVEFDERFGRRSSRVAARFDVDHYLRRQGDKLVARFDAASYVSLMRSMDLHDVGDLRRAAGDTAARVARIIGVGVDTDILYRREEVRGWVEAYREAGATAEYREITSTAGHDAFLIEWDQVEAILRG
jgi:homoserine O-acetyltransferase